MPISDSVLPLLADGAKFLLGVIVGAVVNRKFESRAELVSHWGHASAFQVRNPEGEPFTIHTHEVVVRNAGRKAAGNVRLSHQYLPEQFNIFPSVPHAVEQLPDGTKDIVIPTLVPGQQITVSYLYYPPLLYSGVNAGIRCDDGFAKSVEMELSEKNSRLFNGIAGTLFLVGCGAVLYGLWHAIKRLPF